MAGCVCLLILGQCLAMYGWYGMSVCVCLCVTRRWAWGPPNIILFHFVFSLHGRLMSSLNSSERRNSKNTLSIHGLFLTICDVTAAAEDIERRCVDVNVGWSLGFCAAIHFQKVKVFVYLGLSWYSHGPM